MCVSPFPNQVEHLKLAQENRVLKGVVALNELSRFAEMLERKEGVVQIHLIFGIGQSEESAGSNYVEIKGRLEVEVELECQKCLGKYPFTLDSGFYVKVIRSEEDLQESEDAIICPYDDKLAIRDLIEDELILALPMIPKHELCSLEVEESAQEIHSSAPSSRNKPFKHLKQLLNSEKRS